LIKITALVSKMPRRCREGGVSSTQPLRSAWPRPRAGHTAGNAALDFSAEVGPSVADPQPS